MKNITFRADEHLIARARQVARAQGRSLNTAFREWLAVFILEGRRGEKVEALIKRLKRMRAPSLRRREEGNRR